MKLLTFPILAFTTILLTACVSESLPQQGTMNSASESNTTSNMSTPTSGTSTSEDQNSTNTAPVVDNISSSPINESTTSPLILETTTETESSTTVEAATNETLATTPEDTTSSTTIPVVTPTPIEEPSTETTTAPEEVAPAAQAEILPWLRVPMHYEVLLGQPHIWNEPEAVFGLTLAKSALQDSKILELSSAQNLVAHQLISYLGSNGEYYSNQIQSIEGNTLLLTTPLKQNVSEGANAWNFYHNGSHPNSRGYYALADFAVRMLGKDQLNEGIHVLLGDSWFAEGSISTRLSEILPATTIVNKGIGGQTSANLLARFDEDVLPYNANFVWIIAGVNDYWQDVSTATYKANMDSMISKVIAAGAMPIIIDAPVGPLNGSSDAITLLSHSYVTAIDQLLAEY